MLDIKLLRDHLDEVKARMSTRGIPVDWDQFVSLDRERRDAVANTERLKEKKNRLSGEIGKLKKSGADASALMREVEELSEAIRSSEGPLADIEARFEQLMLTLPNLPHESNLGKHGARAIRQNHRDRRQSLFSARIDEARILQAQRYAQYLSVEGARELLQRPGRRESESRRRLVLSRAERCRQIDQGSRRFLAWRKG